MDLALSGLFEGAEVISVYTRAEAMDDGMLVDVGEMAQEAGIRFPMALTRAAWADLVEWSEGNRGVQDESGRLWDVVYLSALAMRRAARTDRVRVGIHRVPNTPRATVPRRTEFVLALSGGDDGEPVLTVMLDGES